ncbi:hypothetical protein ACFL22_00330 [Patescibacteria group bacterium]
MGKQCHVNLRGVLFLELLARKFFSALIHSLIKQVEIFVYSKEEYAVLLRVFDETSYKWYKILFLAISDVLPEFHDNIFC